MRKFKYKNNRFVFDTGKDNGVLTFRARKKDNTNNDEFVWHMEIARAKSL